jgi:hypothetical protein
VNFVVKNTYRNGCLSNFICSMYGVQSFLQSHSKIHDEFSQSPGTHNFKLENDFLEESLYNEIFDQLKEVPEPAHFISARGVGGKHCSINTADRREGFINENIFNQIFKELKFKDSFSSRLEHLISSNNISDKTLGVHIRLTDSNIQSDKHRSVKLSYEDFDLKIKEMESKYDNIFVASDNHESIEKIVRKYGSSRVKYTQGFWRGDTETEDTQPAAEARVTSNREHCVEAFLDTFALSLCGGIIGRLSAISYCAVVFSENEQEVEMVM